MRSSTSVQGRPVTQAGPQAAARRRAASAVAPRAATPARVAAARSRCSPYGTRTRSGRSIPSANTAATPGSRDTTWRDWSGLRFMVAPTSSRSSAAGSRCRIFSAEFLITSGTSLAGICSATMIPVP